MSTCGNSSYMEGYKVKLKFHTLTQRPNLSGID